jgi:hypothetical protein
MDVFRRAAQQIFDESAGVQVRDRAWPYASVRMPLRSVGWRRRRSPRRGQTRQGARWRACENVARVSRPGSQVAPRRGTYQLRLRAVQSIMWAIRCAAVFDVRCVLQDGKSGVGSGSALRCPNPNGSRPALAHNVHHLEQGAIDAIAHRWRPPRALRCQPPMGWCRPWSALCGARSVCAGSLWAPRATALCFPPPPAVAFSYPSAAALSIPTDGVIWAVGTEGPGAVAIDGVPIAAADASLIGSYYFVPNDALSVGPHELTMTVPDRISNGLDAGIGTSSLSFDVVEGTPEDDYVTNATITAITRYSGDAPSEAFEDDCSEQAVPLTFPCNDTGGPGSSVRIDIDADPSGLGYVVADRILPPTCRAIVISEWGFEPVQYSIAEVLPTGIGPALFFVRAVEDGTVTVQDDRGWCSMGFSRSQGNAGTFGLLAVAALLIRRRRKVPLVLGLAVSGQSTTYCVR